ncbi:MAG: universal stress protein [Deltaproteobacteria bacterium]|nr:universal stress protein [Deltaproteobacteria bacterium]
MRIAVGFNGSELSKVALKMAEAHARAFNAEIYVFTLTPHSPELNVPEIEAAETKLKDIKARLNKEGIPCETHLVIRSLSYGEDLVSLTRDHKIDEFVIGVKNRSRVGKFFMGSTAQFIILNCECPVVVVKL